LNFVNFFFLKLEKQFDSLSQVAAIVHNDFYYLSQEILGFAFQVCIPNLLLLVIIIDDLGFCLMYVSVFLFRILAYKCRYVTNYLFFIFHVLNYVILLSYTLYSHWNSFHFGFDTREGLRICTGGSPVCFSRILVVLAFIIPIWNKQPASDPRFQNTGIWLDCSTPDSTPLPVLPPRFLQPTPIKFLICHAVWAHVLPPAVQPHPSCWCTCRQWNPCCHLPPLPTAQGLRGLSENPRQETHQVAVNYAFYGDGTTLLCEKIECLLCTWKKIYASTSWIDLVYFQQNKKEPVSCSHAVEIYFSSSGNQIK